LIGPNASRAVPALIALLEDKSTPTGQTPEHDPLFQAIDALAAIGPDAEAAIPDLVKLLAFDRIPNNRSRAVRVQNDTIQNHAAAALAKIGRASVPALIEVLYDGEPGARRHAVTALGKIGPAAQDAVDALAEAGDREADPELRNLAFRAIESIQTRR
jgi:HEAT repeat protein